MSVLGKIGCRVKGNTLYTLLYFSVSQFLKNAICHTQHTGSLVFAHVTVPCESLVNPRTQVPSILGLCHPLWPQSPLLGHLHPAERWEREKDEEDSVGVFPG